MQAHGAAQGVGTIPRRGRRLEVLLAIAAIVVVVAVTALLVRGVPPATSGVGAEDVNLRVGAGAAIVHDDAGNMPLGAGSATIHDDAGNMPTGAGPAIVHDDAGNMNSR
jgi:hypothetical protein